MKYIYLLLICGVCYCEETLVYEDGVGACIKFFLPINDYVDKDRGYKGPVKYSSFRICVSKNDKMLLKFDLTGAIDENGYFFGETVIPYDFLNDAKILCLGGPPNSTMGINKYIDIKDFKRIKRDKSWTDQ